MDFQNDALRTFSYWLKYSLSQNHFENPFQGMRRSTGSNELHLQPEKLKSKPFSEPEVTCSHPPDGVSDIKKRHLAENII